MLRRTLTVLLILLWQAGIAQNVFFNATDSARQQAWPKYSFVQVRWQTGKLLNTHTEALHTIEDNPFQAVDIRYGLYGYGRKQWHQFHHYPTYGIGITRFWFNPADNIIGNPLSAYLFFNENVIKLGRSSLGYDFSLGLSCLWEPYDEHTNPGQKAIGSSVNVAVAFKLQYELVLSQRLDLLAGAGVDHFSNGRVRSPNRGLNMLGVNVSARYRLRPRTPVAYTGDKLTYYAPEFIRHDVMPFKPMYELYVVGGAGIVTTFKDVNDRSIFFWAAAASIDVARHYAYTGKYGIGFDWSYDGSVREHYEIKYGNDVPARLLYWPGVHLSHEYMIHRWTLITQGGINIKVRSDKGYWYGRIALRYDITDRVFIRTGIRLYDTFISDFIETGAGISFYRR